MDKIYTITMAPSIDYFVYCNNFQLGKINRTEKEEYMTAGGKGINVSMVLKNLGVESTALGFVAGFTGDAIEAKVRSHGVNVDFIKVEGNSRINVKMRSDSDETELNGQGTRVDESAMQELMKKLDKIEDESWLILAGNIPASMPLNTYERILDRVKNKKIRVIVDCSEKLLKSVLPYKPFLVKPNQDEAVSVFGKILENKTSWFKAANKFRELGAENVILSLGSKGACMVTEDDENYYIPAPEGKLVNSIGSGDSLVAGFVAGCIKYGDLYRHALILGVAAGSASAFTRGLADGESIQKVLSGMKDLG